MSDLEQRLARIEAAEAIKSLKQRYARACDTQYDPQLISELFTEDGVWDGGERYGVHRGRKAIYDFFANVSDLVPWAVHYIVGPDVEMADDAQSATGRWYLWQTCNHYIDGELVPVMIAGRYEDVYVKEDDGWKMKELHLRLEAITPQLEGWAKKRFYDDPVPAA